MTITTLRHPPLPAQRHRTRRRQRQTAWPTTPAPASPTTNDETCWSSAPHEHARQRSRTGLFGPRPSAPPKTPACTGGGLACGLLENGTLGTHEDPPGAFEGFDVAGSAPGVVRDAMGSCVQRAKISKASGRREPRPEAGIALEPMWLMGRSVLVRP